MATPFSGIGGIKRQIGNLLDFPSITPYLESQGDAREGMRGLLTTPVQGYTPTRATEDFVPTHLLGKGLDPLLYGNAPDWSAVSAGSPDVLGPVGAALGLGTDAVKAILSAKRAKQITDLAKSKYAGKTFGLELQPKPRKVTAPKPKPKPEFYGYPGNIKTKRQAKALENRMYGDIVKYAKPSDYKWYDDFGGEVRRVTEGSPEYRERVIRTAAILSANQGATQNVRDTVRAASLIAQGKTKLAIGQHPNIVQPRLIKVLKRDLFDERVPFDRNLEGVGRKVENFYQQMKSSVYGTPPPQTVVVDRHQLRFGGWPQKTDKIAQGDLGEAQYDVQEQMIQRVAKRLGVTPGEAQAAGWGAQQRKTGGDPSGFAEALEEMEVVMPVAWGAPDPDTQVGQYVGKNYDPFVQEQLGKAVERAADPKKLAAPAGIWGWERTPGYGAFEGAIEPNTVYKAPVPVKPGNVLESDIPNQASAAFREAGVQNKAAWWRARPELSGKKGVMQGFKVEFTDDVDIPSVRNALAEKFGSAQDFSVVGPRTIHTVNFLGDPNFEKNVSEVFENSKLVKELRQYGVAKGEHAYYGKEQGDQYLSGASLEPGRPDLREGTGRARARVEQTLENITGRGAAPRPKFTDRQEAGLRKWQEDMNNLARHRTVAGTHYGKAGLETVDPEYLGTGRWKIPPEVRRGGRAHEPGFLPASSWGSKRYRREPNLPARPENVYHADLEGVYNLSGKADVGAPRKTPFGLIRAPRYGNDPLKLRAEARRLANAGYGNFENILEHLITGRGFSGYEGPGGIMRYFDPVKVK